MRRNGFTLVELVVILVVIGILSIAALPRFFERTVFEARGFYDETKSLLRYGQKAAIAQRRTVCVALNANGVALSIAAAAGAAATCNAALALPNPPRGGVGLSSSVNSFRFDSQGATDQGADITITVTDAIGTITVDRVTGYVR